MNYGFIGAQRETIMNGKLAAALDLNTLAGRTHLYGLGPLERLRGRVARGFELEGAGAGPGDRRAVDAVARQEVAGAAGLVGGLCDRLAALVPAA